MKKNEKLSRLILIILIVISILNSGCTEKYENPGNAPQNLETAVPTKTQNPVPTKTQNPIPATEKIQLENYDGGIFSMKKPAGWEVITAGSCATLGILARDRNAPENQVFIFALGSRGREYFCLRGRG